jgi:hypothetical protein
MLTPSNALEANYGITYQNSIGYYVNPNHYKILTRTQEMSGAFVHSFVFKNFNPFVEAGPAALIFLPIVNSGTTTLDSKQQTAVGGLFGAGFAYEISPSFDIRAEYRGYCHQGAHLRRLPVHHQPLVSPLDLGSDHRRGLPLLRTGNEGPRKQGSRKKGIGHGRSPFCVPAASKNPWASLVSFMDCE